MSLTISYNRPPTESASATSSCRLLELPAELRNQIYELAFTTDQDSEGKVDLFAGKAPTKSLLLTCRQIHSEAHGIYNTAYRRFWKESDFVASQRTLHKKRPGKKGYEKVDTITKADLSKLRDADIANITKLTLHVPLTVFVLTDMRGVWHRTTYARSVDARGRWSHAPVDYQRPYVASRYPARKGTAVDVAQWVEGPDIASVKGFLDGLKRQVTLQDQLLGIFAREQW